MSQVELEILICQNRVNLLSMRNKENDRIVRKLIRRIRALEAKLA